MFVYPWYCQMWKIPLILSQVQDTGSSWGVFKGTGRAKEVKWPLARETLHLLPELAVTAASWLGSSCG